MPTITGRRSAGRALTTALAVAVLALGGCDTTGSAAAQDGQLDVTVSFYPLQFVTERLGGPDLHVSSLTRAGVEPHDLDLTARDVARLQTSDLAVYLSGFQSAVDQAIATAHPRAVLEVSAAARLDLGPAPLEDGEQHAEHADPHFWLDPTRLATVADAVARQLSALAPDRADAVAARLATLRSDLAAVDDAYRTGLRDCARRDLITSHSAFGYLAHRYRLTQIPISGLSPEAEPQARQLATVTRLVRARHATTIYYETLVSPDVARTVARSTGAGTAVLDPIEGLTADSAGRDYLQLMDANLAALRTGLGCS